MSDNYIYTVSGERFYYGERDPKKTPILLTDISGALSKLCRYTGQCPLFYSVAEHSCLVTKIVKKWGASKAVQRMALLHDAAEAYMADLPRPLKGLLPYYSELESVVGKRVHAAFGIGYPEFSDGFTNLVETNDLEIVADADKAALGLEMTQFFGEERVKQAFKLRKPFPVKGFPIYHWNPSQADNEFLIMARDLGVSTSLKE